ncbi:MAG: N-acetylglucosamine-6-phosphate deacetylase, partial [Actinomycetota bacterium]|nr:N-acetylglucosamine-6-phosphate deacetylase [Actinomycetota bacterium]
ARAAYAARSVQTPLGAVEGISGTLTLACARVLNGESGQSPTPAWLTIADGRIVASGSGDPPPGAVDLGDALLTPGFVDLQVNGTGAVDFASAAVEEIVTAVDALVAGGTTGMLLTICSAPLDAYDVMLERARRVRAARPDAVIGVHLEGPFLGGAPGAHPPEVLRPADIDFVKHLHETYGDLVRIVTLAPEADPGLAATRLLVRNGVVVALGHSTIDYDGARSAAGGGARMVTHLFNGMAPMHHRAPGLAGAALDDARLVPSVIVDFVHVHPALVKVALTARVDAVLVTDAVATEPPVLERDGAAYLANGTLAGSTLTMVGALRNVVSLGLPAARAVRHVTANPARVLGLADRGRIASGARADLVALDPDTLAVRAVWVAGRPV